MIGYNTSLDPCNQFLLVKEMLGCCYYCSHVRKLFLLQLFMGRSLRVARGRRFVKQAVEEGASSEQTSSELSLSGAEADNAD